MAIAVQDIVNRCNAALDAEGSDRYLFDRDYIYAINHANEWIVSLFNAAFSENKLSEESLRELTRARVFQASTNSRVAFDSTEVGDTLWSILAIWVDIETIPSSYTPPTPTVESAYLDDVSFGSSSKSAKRLTSEQWAEKGRNYFVPGNGYNSTNADLIDYAYLNPIDYAGGGGYSLSNNAFEIEISPSISGELIAIAYLKQPDSITLIGDNLEFPSSLINMFVDATLNYISYKNTDGMTQLYGVSEDNVRQLVGLMT